MWMSVITPEGVKRALVGHPKSVCVKRRQWQQCVVKWRWPDTCARRKSERRWANKGHRQCRQRGGQRGAQTFATADECSMANLKQTEDVASPVSSSLGPSTNGLRLHYKQKETSVCLCQFRWHHCSQLAYKVTQQMDLIKDSSSNRVYWLKEIVL